jgi:hypothetical protein
MHFDQRRGLPWPPFLKSTRVETFGVAISCVGSNGYKLMSRLGSNGYNSLSLLGSNGYMLVSRFKVRRNLGRVHVVQSQLGDNNGYDPQVVPQGLKTLFSCVAAHARIWLSYWARTGPLPYELTQVGSVFTLG